MGDIVESENLATIANDALKLIEEVYTNIAESQADQNGQSEPAADPVVADVVEAEKIPEEQVNNMTKKLLLLPFYTTNYI
jgi:hypothetical protein